MAAFNPRAATQRYDSKTMTDIIPQAVPDIIGQFESPRGIS